MNEFEDCAYYFGIGMVQGVLARVQASKPLMTQEIIINGMARVHAANITQFEKSNAIDEANKSTHEGK